MSSPPKGDDEYEEQPDDPPIIFDLEVEMGEEFQETGLVYPDGRPVKRRQRWGLGFLASPEEEWS